MKKTITLALVLVPLSAAANPPAVPVTKVETAPVSAPPSASINVIPAQPRDLDVPSAAQQPAPVSDPAGLPVPQQQQPDAWMKYASPYAAEQNNIINAHRSNEEITQWGATAVSDSLSVAEGAFMTRVAEFKKYFTPASWREYGAYLQGAKLLDLMRSGKYGIVTVADGEPKLMSSGPQNGAYQWLLSVPATLTVTQRNPQGEEKVVSTRRQRIQVAVTRTAQGGGADGLVIGSWRVEAVTE
jgi:Type-IV b secretion system, inner-membrane complex component